jgi:hypothetical protein
MSPVAGIVAVMRTRRCPLCGSARIARVKYGMPTAQQFEDERYYWAGCLVEVGSERRYGCHDCDAQLDRPATSSPAVAG